MEQKVLPILSCDAKGAVKLDKGAAMFLVNGGVIPGYRVKASIRAVKKDDDGKPLCDEEGNPIIEHIEDLIVSVEIGYMKEG